MYTGSPLTRLALFGEPRTPNPEPRTQNPMKPTGKYTCTEYRQEMILLGLKRQLEDPVLPDAQRVHVAEKIRELERQMGMD